MRRWSAQPDPPNANRQSSRRLKGTGPSDTSKQERHGQEINDEEGNLRSRKAESIVRPREVARKRRHFVKLHEDVVLRHMYICKLLACMVHTKLFCTLILDDQIFATATNVDDALPPISGKEINITQTQPESRTALYSHSILLHTGIHCSLGALHSIFGRVTSTKTEIIGLTAQREQKGEKRVDYDWGHGQGRGAFGCVESSRNSLNPRLYLHSITLTLSSTYGLLPPICKIYHKSTQTHTYHTR